MDPCTSHSDDDPRLSRLPDRTGDGYLERSSLFPAAGRRQRPARRASRLGRRRRLSKPPGQFPRSDEEHIVEAWGAPGSCHAHDLDPRTSTGHLDEAVRQSHRRTGERTAHPRRRLTDGCFGPILEGPSFGTCAKLPPRARQRRHRACEPEAPSKVIWSGCVRVHASCDRNVSPCGDATDDETLAGLQ
ncbi:hypothetical protein BV20DRAFT_491851 [Pilatotrama ljubarskyi]|nr:hypothetical protein BV20DRAFT_491851 [Pilatotrama ljubarskyi]